ncbi:MAG TPA: MBL fold metallo-hydrolase [Chitinophagales bacterium]|nr:MBL fold metallo-hydrolase [Chitinophagales bacterium]
MQITFHGAARMVTGSKHLLTLDSGTKILLDCGLFQGNPREADLLNRDWGFVPAEVDMVILSHAHIDHCGLLPRLVAEGFKGKIYCTPVTFDMVKILLLDSAHIHESDVRYHNKKRARRSESPVEALYTIKDAERCFNYFEMVDYNVIKKISNEVKFHFTDVGHIIGSAAIHLVVNEKGKECKLSFSGDVGRYNDELLCKPETFPQADFIILESTYGDALHQDASTTHNKLLTVIAETCLKKRGRLIIPSFSVGRTQEIVYALNRLEISKKLPNIRFFVDSPLSVEATGVMKKHMDVLNESFQQYRKIDSQPFDFKNLHYITDVEESKALNERNEPCVIISASGMADAGRVKHHIKNNIGDKRNTILIVGYCEPNSLGGKLSRGYKTVTIFGEEFNVNANIERMQSLSAHGDYDDLCRFMECQDASLVKKLFLVHGEYETQQTFADKLKRKGFRDIQIPALHQSYDLS